MLIAGAIFIFIAGPEKVYHDLEFIYLFCIWCSTPLEFWSNSCVQKQKQGNAVNVYSGWTYALFILYRASGYLWRDRPAYHGRDAPLVFVFLPVAGGLLTYLRWNYRWILSFTTLLSSVFIIINIASPDIHNKVLMPALQSPPWFAPHVIIYMFSYAIVGAATLVAIYYLARENKIVCKAHIMNMTDNMVYAGVACITLGMLMGAIWAKDAWGGHYWSWDPKETWAAATWLGGT